ncbi:DUF499 domain-containing protein [Treponema primitia]|uniref:DUF499 domain-containing protein n=1 Tax=Treponema primitia TaxID=88058 RepID=UPI0002554BF9|nr:DUF499 domain-containing protein [Treponema primitia]
MEYWYNVAIPRKEVREGRSFNPDEFAIHLEQVINKTAPEDYSDPGQFFSRTCFTRALREHTAMVLRRLSGKTANTAPVMTLITQFGGGKTHTLTTLYHLVTSAKKAADYSGVAELLKEANLSSVPEAKVAAFVGNSWDPTPGRETPWLDIAFQLAGDAGIKELGESAKTIPPGTEALIRVFKAVNKPVLLLFDEVLNFLNRHRNMDEQFYAFIQNLTIAVTGTTHGAILISLPRSQTEMTERDMQWQDKITKVVRRVAKDLIANDEAEIGEVVRRRLFESIGREETRKAVAKTYAEWYFEHRAQLPPEWTSVDTSVSEASAKDLLYKRFETCYPFHPATLSVFQRKWQALPQYQQTRGTLSMLAQWVSQVFQSDHINARKEPLITLGSAPLDIPEFRSVVLGQLGESRLLAAINTDISDNQSHAQALDADTSGPLQNIHRRVGTTILFESSGGQVDKIAHLPELRFALCEPEIDTTSIDTAAYKLESKSYFIRKVGSDGYKIGYQPTLKKVVSDRRASLDEETEIIPAIRKTVEEEFKRNATIPIISFPADEMAIPDSPKLTMVVADPLIEWSGEETGTFQMLRKKIASWTSNHGTSPRLYPGSLIWCLKRPGRELRECIENKLAWERVHSEIRSGTLGSDFSRDETNDIGTKTLNAKDYAKEEVWGGYRYAVIYDACEKDSLKVIDLGAGHSSASETLCSRILTALKSNALLNETVGAGYIERNWPPALKEIGAWPLSSLRQSFLNGSLTRLLDPDSALRLKICDFVFRGEFGLSSGKNAFGTYSRIWYQEQVFPEEVSFEPEVYLLLKSQAQKLKKVTEQSESSAETSPVPDTQNTPESPVPDSVQSKSTQISSARIEQNIIISGTIPPDSFNRIGTRLIPKIRLGKNLRINLSISFSIDSDASQDLLDDLIQAINDIGISEDLKVQ